MARGLLLEMRGSIIVIFFAFCREVTQEAKCLLNLVHKRPCALQHRIRWVVAWGTAA